MTRKRKQGDPRRAVGYVRVSTDDQTIGAEVQEEAIREWCQRREIALIGLHRDVGISGGSDLGDRPGLSEAFEDLRDHGAGILLALRRDRWARDTMVAATIERAAMSAGAVLRTVDGAGDGDTPADRLVKTMLDGVAEFERSMIRSRTSAALRRMQATAKAAGGFAPYGWRKVGKALEPVPEELAAVSRMRELATLGACYEEIRRVMEAEGWPSRSGRWHRQTVRRALGRTSIPDNRGGLSQSA